jgi:hypothetical protein
VFQSVVALETAIKAYIEANNATPKSLSLTETSDDMLASINRFCLRTLGKQAWDKANFGIGTLAGEHCAVHAVAPDLTSL